MVAAVHQQLRVSDRAALIGIAVSILLHAAILFLFPGMRQGPSSSNSDQVLKARLMPRSEIRERSVVPEPEQRQPEPPKRFEPPRPVTQPPVAALPAPSPRLATPAPSSAAPATPPAAAAPAAPAAPPVAAPAPPPPAARQGADGQASAAADGARPQPSADAGSIDRFRQDVLIATRRYKRYPAQAMEKGWEGRVEIHLAIGSNGMTQSFRVKTSSGFQLLDDTALDMVRKARGIVQIPPALRGREFVVDVTVIFNMRDG